MTSNISLTSIPVTAVFAALLALLLVAVSIRVTLLRRKKKVSFADGGDKELARAIRVQGNFIEYVPMALILIGLLEWMSVKSWVIYGLGAALFIGRVSHAWGLYAGVFQARAAGVALTWAVLGVAALLVLGLVA